MIYGDAFQNIKDLGNPEYFQKSYITPATISERRLLSLRQQTPHDIGGIHRFSMFFYKFGNLILRDKIGNEYLVKFSISRLADMGRRIWQRGDLSYRHLVDNHPYHTQQLA